MNIGRRQTGGRCLAPIASLRRSQDDARRAAPNGPCCSTCRCPELAR